MKYVSGQFPGDFGDVFETSEHTHTHTYNIVDASRNNTICFLLAEFVNSTFFVVYTIKKNLSIL